MLLNMLLMVTLVAAGTWNPPMEETKTAEPPPRDSKRGTQAWEEDEEDEEENEGGDGDGDVDDGDGEISAARRSTSLSNRRRRIVVVKIVVFNHLEEKEGCFHIDLKYLVPSLEERDIIFIKVSQCLFSHLLRTSKCGSKVRIDRCIGDQNVQTSPPWKWFELQIMFKSIQYREQECFPSKCPPFDCGFQQSASVRRLPNMADLRAK